MIVPIQSLDDPRIALYRNLKDRELAREGDRFIAEGELVTRRLIASEYPTESVLCSPRMALEISPLLNERTVLYQADDALIHEIVGFRFHRGCLGIGRRVERFSLDDVVSKPTSKLILVCEDLNSAENLGSIIRTAAGLGVNAIILGERCVDPFWRLCIRVSMGAVFSLPIIRSRDLVSDVKKLNENRFQTLASVCSESATPIDRIQLENRVALLLGSEAHGLSKEIIEASTIRVTIPMHHHIDSLNVSIACAIMLYELCRPIR